MIIEKLSNENYKVITRPVRSFGTSGMVSLPAALENEEVYVLIKTKPKRTGDSSSKIILPKNSIGSEVELIIPINLNYKTIYVDNKRKLK